VTLHARNAQNTADLRAALPHAALVLGDLSGIADVRRVAEQVIALGRHDAVIHNAAVYRVPDRIRTDADLSLTFALNVLAPYLLTALIERPDRLVYLTSGLQNGVTPDLDDAGTGTAKSREARRADRRARPGMAVSSRNRRPTPRHRHGARRCRECQ
jgi:hypothetical protein